MENQFKKSDSYITSESSSSSDDDKDQEELIPYRPELKNVNKQILNVIGYKDLKHPKTIFFYYNDKSKINLPKGCQIYKLEITDKKFMVMYKAYKNIPQCLYDPLNYNKIIHSKIFDNTNIIWKLLKKDKMFPLLKTLNVYQRFNHFPMTWELSRKDNLAKHFFEMQKKFPNDFDYLPETYVLPQDEEIFRNKIENYQFDKDNLWLIKPVASSRGRGIRLMTDPKDIPTKTLISHYISNPHLINNKKYDLRLYLLITGYNPLKIYLYDNGLIRFCSEEYDLDEDKLNDKFIHLTNYSINKNSAAYEKNENEQKEEGNKWSLHTYKKHFEDNNINFNEIWDKIKDIMIKTILSVTELAIPLIKQFNLTSNNLFELYGVDVLIDENFKPWLMEINLNPSLNCDSNLDLNIKSKVITDIFNIIGCVPFSHDGKFTSFEKETEFKNEKEKNLFETICEFRRPSGGFERIFPKSDNINIYNKFINNPGEENESLWKYMLKNNI